VRLAQVTFSAAALILSGSITYQASHLLLGRSAVDSPMALVILAGSLYLPLNTALVAAVVGLVHGRPARQVVWACYEYVFPYFMCGMVFAGLISGAFSRASVWKGAIILLPIAILGYVYMLSHFAVVVPAAAQLTPTEDEELVEVGSK